MRCDEIQPLQGAYLDSELDARTTLEIQQHLKSCPECARLFTEEQNFEAWITSGLKQGERSAAFWEKAERAILGAAGATHSQPSPPLAQRGGWATLFAPLARQLRAGWSGTPRAWAGIAVAWMVILTLNLATRETEMIPVARQATPSASEMRFALKQKQLLLAELAVTAEAAGPGKGKAAAPRPRSQKQENNLKT
jgi:putative zinc finger protein